MPIIQTTTWMRIKSKTTIVAGGSRGLDKEMAKALAEAGADMTIVLLKELSALSEQSRAETVECYSMAIKADVTKFEKFER
jgi:NAD(P)-dependent dehydrogenase (short-subunit alcohol dehydrogenase family)